jgi:hypothetical protein
LMLAIVITIFTLIQRQFFQENSLDRTW